jgi:hypothetical protein
MNAVEARLDRIRGQVAPKGHNAQTIAALASNPGCARRAIVDAAGVHKQQLASYAEFPARFGQSQFAIGRSNAFEAQVKTRGCAKLLRLVVHRLLGASRQLAPRGSGAATEADTEHQSQRRSHLHAVDLR